MGRGGIREGRRKRIHRCEVFKGLRGGADQVEGWAGLVQSYMGSNGFGSSCGECQVVQDLRSVYFREFVLHDFFRYVICDMNVYVLSPRLR